MLPDIGAEKQRDKALSIIASGLEHLSKTYRECYLVMGRGALLVHADSAIKNGGASKTDYRNKHEMLEIFDTPTSSAKLARMIDDYDARTEGIMMLIASYSNATYFVTEKLIG